jgi:hypothetical protein
VTASPSYNAYKRAGWHNRHPCGESPQNLQKGLLEVLEALAPGKSPRFASISQVTDLSTPGH